MALFDTFRKDLAGRKNDKIKKEEEKRQEALLSLENALHDMGAKNTEAKINTVAAVHACRRAISRGDAMGLKIAKTQLRSCYAMFVYTQALQNNLRMMKSNVDMQEMTVSFAKVVQSVAGITIPSGKVNFNKLTRDALKTLSPIDIDGATGMLQSVIDGSLSATDILGSSEISDSFLDKLINDESLLDQETYSVSANSMENGQTNQAEKLDDNQQAQAKLDQLDDLIAQLGSDLND